MRPSSPVFRSDYSMDRDRHNPTTRSPRPPRSQRRLPSPPIPALHFPVAYGEDQHATICKQFQQSAQALHLCQHQCTRTLRRRSSALAAHDNSSFSSFESDQSSSSGSSSPGLPLALQGLKDAAIDPQFSNTIQQVLHTLLTYERLFRKNAIPPCHAQTELTEVYSEILELLRDLTAYAGEATAEISVITQVLISLTIKKHGQAVTEAVARFADALKQESARLAQAMEEEEDDNEEALDVVM